MIAISFTSALECKRFIEILFEIKMENINKPNKFMGVYRLIFILLTLITSIALIIGGFKLVKLDGSSYYLIAGIAYLVIAVLYAVRNKIGVWLSGITFVATVIWALSEVGLSYWHLVPRLVVPALLFMLSLWLTSTFPAIQKDTCKRIANRTGIVVFVALFATLVAAFFPQGKVYNPVELQKNPELASTNSGNGDNWEFFGRNSAGTRFAPYTQITPDNVNELQVAWTYRTGRVLKNAPGAAAGADENTPLQIGSVLYSCTPTNIIAAIDADTGKEIWKFDPKAQSAEHVSCRGVGYYDATTDNTISKVAFDDKAQCQQRIIVSSVDARLFALDAHTGELCQDFGDKGFVDLKPNMGDTGNSRAYHPTAIPVVMGHIAVIGGWVLDIKQVQPSGVVRAYDVRDGSLVWAWDVGRPDNAGKPADGQTYTLSSPNVWATPSFDKELNLVYLPTGNGPPDYWGGDRNEIKEKFGSSVVAVDASTGKTKWLFQTVHHDVWDYDVPSQPTLVHLKNKEGESVPVLIQTTKMGQIFVLDRRTGKPFYNVEERPVPTTPSAKEEKLSPTQPFSTEIATIGADPLTEKSMWGASTFDQLWCRLEFKELNYQGPYTPPTEQRYIEWPSLLGGMNWGGVSVDESTGMMFVNDLEMPLVMSLKTKEQAAGFNISTDEVPGFMGTIRPQEAGPYVGIKIDYMMSPLGVPCNTPPFGTMSAVDLNSGKLVWQVPMGTIKDSYDPVKSNLPIPIGLPTLGGPTSTASGLVFFAGTQDYYLRALDAKNGKEIWKVRLPVGAVAAPLIYQSPKTGKQYVVISAGGASHSPDVGDYIIAYALPDSVKK